MTQTAQPGSANWTLLQKIAFRFCCIYFLLQITPWTWLDNSVPGIGYVTRYYDRAISWIVDMFNKYCFHLAKTTIINNGSGDTSHDWEMVFTFLSLAVAGCIVWSLPDRKRKSYTQANYWLCTFLDTFLSLCVLYMELVNGMHYKCPSQPKAS